jgi:transcription elongation GreA/GreB family factor
VGGRVGDTPEFNGPRGRVSFSILAIE